MKKRYTEKQIVGIVKRVETGTYDITTTSNTTLLNVKRNVYIE